MNWLHWLIEHLSQETGTLKSTSRAYNFWSGFGSDLGEVAMLGAGVGIYRRHKCHTCFRPVLKHGQGKVEGTHYETCHKHTTSDHHERLKKQHGVLHPMLHAHLGKKP